MEEKFTVKELKDLLEKVDDASFVMVEGCDGHIEDCIGITIDDNIVLISQG